MTTPERPNQLCVIVRALDAAGSWLTVPEIAELPLLQGHWFSASEIEVLLERARKHQPRLVTFETHRGSDEWSVTDEGRRFCGNGGAPEVNEGGDDLPGKVSWRQVEGVARGWLPMVISIAGIVIGAISWGRLPSGSRRDYARLALLAAAGTAIGIALSEDGRHKALDLLFGAEEVFGYTSSPAGTSAFG